jgi:hypothetical protein
LWTFDADATDTLRLAACPANVFVGGIPLVERGDLADAGYVVHMVPSGDSVVRARHRSRGTVVVTLRQPR